MVTVDHADLTGVGLCSLLGRGDLGAVGVVAEYFDVEAATGGGVGHVGEVTDEGAAADDQFGGERPGGFVEALGVGAGADSVPMVSPTPVPVVEAVHVSKSFGDTPVLDDVSVAVEPGQVLVVHGENGTGKP